MVPYVVGAVVAVTVMHVLLFVLHVFCCETVRVRMTAMLVWGPVSAYMGGTCRSGVLARAVDASDECGERCRWSLCVSLGAGSVGGERIGFGLYQFWRNMGKVGYVWAGGLGQGGWCYVCVCCESIKKI